MAKVIGKEELCRIDDFKKYFKSVLGVGGKTLFDRYKSAEKNIINKYIDPEYFDFLAYPVQDDSSITFHGKKHKEAPQLFSELTGEELIKYSAIKEQTLTHYNTKIELLKSKGKTAEAEFLEGAVKYVDNRFLYCYDDKLVLGIWGMQLRNNVRGDINEICKNLAVKKKPLPVPENPIHEVVPEPEIEPEYIQEDTLPIAPPVPPIIIKKTPWYKRFWCWLSAFFTGRGCLEWLLRLFLFLLLLLLLLFLFRNCNSCSRNHLGGGDSLGDNDSAWLKDDPARGNDGGIYDPYKPYDPVPTPPGYEDLLPPQQGVLPPIEGKPDIFPGDPSIIANRLNILMENQNKTIFDLAKDFKIKYPDEKYKVVYYDDVVKRMQIEIPKEEREQLKQLIPAEFAPEYELFLFDEALFEGTYTPNDPIFSDSDKAWYLNAINAPHAWDITLGSEKITVAIVDNGFNLKHPELSSKVVQPYNVWKHSNEFFPQQIDHGTHVAGTALAIADNGKGISGIAPNCKFMPIQVADERGLMTTTTVLDGILYALYQGADVINISLGTQFTGLSEYPESTQQEMIQNRFKEEERLWREIMRIAANHNSTIVVAAGNDNVLAGVDALHRPELFITVSATNKKNQNFSKAEFSNYGEFSTISAPGVGIYSSVGKNGYELMDGTSMAAPIVAGAVALMKSINDTITTKQIICILQATGLQTQGNIGKLLQLDKALEMLKSKEEVDCTPQPSTGDVQILLSWNNYNDLDLMCTDPFDETIFFKNPRAASGGQLEIDMNVEYPDTKTPIEHIYWESGKAPNGTYNIFLQYSRKYEAAIDETPYSIDIQYGGKTENYRGVIKKEDGAISICSFTLGEAIANPQNPTSPPADDKLSKLEQERDRLQQELERVNRELKKIRNRR